jgi:tyrosyl-tRNA synthetase
MDTDTRLRLITQNLQEIITLDELRRLLETNDHPRGYVGFEPSGMMHAGTGLVVGKKMKDYADAGFHFIIYLAEWHGWINNKLGGDLDNIRAGAEYFKDCFTALGLPPGKVEYLWASDIVSHGDYWEKVVRVMKAMTMKRALRAMPIMGRSADSEDVEASWVLYPALQTSDIFQMKLDAACSGMDQRKVHMLAREIAPKLNQKVPVCLHSPLLPGLQDMTIQGSFDEDEDINKTITQKMSKSVAKGAIWVNDSPQEIRQKYKEAYCPPKQAMGNPILEHVRLVIFPHAGKLEITRPMKFGGDATFESYEELSKSYAEGKLHPMDLKNAVAEKMIELLEPVRCYFEKKPENLERMKQLRVTR